MISHLDSDYEERCNDDENYEEKKTKVRHSHAGEEKDGRSGQHVGEGDLQVD
jgi:hypothetical protein